MNDSVRRALVRDSLGRVGIVGVQALVWGCFWWQTRLLGFGHHAHVAVDDLDPTVIVLSCLWLLEMARLMAGAMHNFDRATRGELLQPPYR